MVVGGQHHAPAALPPEKRPGTHRTGGWVGPRTWTGTDILALTGNQSADSPSHCKWLYRLRYPSPRNDDRTDKMFVKGLWLKVEKEIKVGKGQLERYDCKKRN
jgi:hypothetical protein